MKILVIEDDNELRESLRWSLERGGFQVVEAADGAAGLACLEAEMFNVVVIDLMLPKIGGLQLLMQARAGGLRAPVLILSAKSAVAERVEGLRAGGDDYLVKPFAMDELLARVEALLRRSPLAQGYETLHFADLTLDLRTRKVTRGLKEIELQAKEFDLLKLFLQHPNRVVTKTQILKCVWNYDFDPQTNVVDVLVFRLRAKIDQDYPEKRIQTARGLGYVLR